MSRHRPLPVQERALPDYLGEDVRIEQDPNPFSNAEEIVRRYRCGGYDDMVVVAPLSVIARLVDLGIRPIWCEMEVVSEDEHCDIKYRDRRYAFRRFRRIRRVAVEFED